MEKDTEIKSETVFIDEASSFQKNMEHVTMEKEIESLKEQLEEARSIVRSTQDKMHGQQIQYNYTITLLKRQVHQCKRENESIRSTKDQQLQQIMSQVMLLEARIRRERKHILSVLSEKEEIIKKHLQENQELKDKNERLTFVVNVLSRKSISASMDNLLLGSPDGMNPSVTEKDKGSLRGKFSFMKGKLKRHRSTLDLQSASDSTVYSNNCDLQSFLAHSEDKKNNKVTLRQNKATSSRERCNSTPGVILQWENLYENIGKHSMQNGETCIPEEDIIDDFGRSCLLDESPSEATVDGVVLNVNTLCNSKSSQNRSMPDMQTILSNGDHEGSVNLKSDDGSPPDSNPLKTFKSIIKRKGSKLKGKKRSISLPQGVNEEYQVVLQKQYQQMQKRQ